ncbi:MAG: periplasmic protein CpxP/Spy [Acidobacteriota bacterium]|jgi:protein CpxP|nr:periplasmic protein CpxP/Spy [Acidobacteriota bacterium]
MNKKITAVAAVLALSTTLAFAGTGEGRGEGRHGRHGKGQFGEKFAQKLNLTDAQKQQIKDIRTNSRTQNAQFFATAKQTREDARAARKAGDTARLESLKGALQSQRAQMKEIRKAERQQVLNILNAEQRAQLEAMKAQHQGRHHNDDNN